MATASSQTRTPSPQSVDNNQPEPLPTTNLHSAPLLWRLYFSHALSTWNSRTFEFGSVLFLATIFPGTLFYVSCYALFRSAAAAVLGSWIGELVDSGNRLTIVRHSIIWQRYPVAISCLVLLVMVQRPGENNPLTLSLFAANIFLACLEKLASVANTITVERDWIIVVSDSLGMERQELNSAMRRIDLVCKLLAPICISFVDGYSTTIAIWVILGQNVLSVMFEYFAIAHIFRAIPELAQERSEESAVTEPEAEPTETTEREHPNPRSATTPPGPIDSVFSYLGPWRSYFSNPAFLASFSLSILYLTVLSFGYQMTTYLLTIGFSSIHISLMKLVAVILELTATCATPVLIRKIGAVRSGLWFINEQLISVILAMIFFFADEPETKLAGGILVIGVIFSRVGLWGFDLCVQYLVQEDAPADSRGSFSAVEAALQNFFELISFAITMVFHRPDQFYIPAYISAIAVAVSSTFFARFVRQKRGHLLHTSKCFKRERRAKYNVLPTIEEEE